MRKSVVCIFAHPDDEAFGPAGAIAKYAKTHYVYILCVTKGEAGISDLPQSLGAIATVREQELHKSAEALGVKKVYFLGFQDGTLSNNLYHKIAEKIETHLKKLKPEIIMTFEPHGVSGHIDHIVVSYITTYVFYRLKFIKTLLYYCISDKRRARIKDYFVYFPPGYKKSQIHKTVPIADVWDQKVQAMHCHISQKHDSDRILKETKELPKEEYFLVLKK